MFQVKGIVYKSCISSQFHISYLLKNHHIAKSAESRLRSHGISRDKSFHRFPKMRCPIRPEQMFLVGSPVINLRRKWRRDFSHTFRRYWSAECTGRCRKSADKDPEVITSLAATLNDPWWEQTFVPSAVSFYHASQRPFLLFQFLSEGNLFTNVWERSTPVIGVLMPPIRSILTF